MQTRLTLDDAAWTNRWRHRSTVEKGTLALGLLTVALTTGPVGGVLVLVVASVAACGLARVPPRTWLTALASPLVFIVLAVLSITVTLDRPQAGVLWEVGPLIVTDATLLRGVEVFLRSLPAAACLVLLATTTPVPHLLASAARVPGLAVLADIAGVMYRLLFGLREAQAAVRESQAARLGFRTSRAARHSTGMLAGAVFIRAWNQARRLEAGLAGRGYTGGALGVPTTTQVDRGFLVVSVIVVAAVAVAAIVLPGWNR